MPKVLIKKSLLVFLILLLIGQANVFAQAQGGADPNLEQPFVRTKEPVMKSVFWNTLWGATWGATISGIGALQANEVVRTAAISGASTGIVLGVSFGVFLVVNGLSFNQDFIPSLLTLDNKPATAKLERPKNNINDSPFQVSFNQHPVTKKVSLEYQATIFDFKF